MSQDEPGEASLSPVKMLGIALAVYLIWTLATYLLEGRVHLLISGDPVGRLAYAVIANILIGTVGALVVMNLFRRQGGIPREYFGFQPAKRTLFSLIGAFVLGLRVFTLQSQKTLDPVVVLNVFAQVFTTSTAEVLVVYALVGVAGAWMTRSLGNVPSGIVGIALASVLFGAYHIAHSPPFSTLSMILLLTFVGVVTGVFYFLVREIYATIVFHNFPALFGVMQNVDPAMFASPNTFLLGTMLITVVILVGTERYLLRR